jgi:peptide/nickel transport system substrate-binding protein
MQGLVSERRGFLKFSVAAAALTLVSQGNARASRKQDNVLKIGVSGELYYNMLCFKMTGQPLDYVYSLPVYESLFRPNAFGTVDPWLLCAYEADPAGLAYIFHVRKGVTFSDGTRLDAAVVKWNIDHYLKVGSKRVALLGSIKSVEWIDDYSLKIHLSTWSSIIPTAFSRECGYMFSKAHYERYGDAYCQEHPVGTGPFVLKQWERNVSKLFVRNPTYWGGPVALDAVAYTIYNDAVVGQAALIAGEVDVFAGMELTGLRPLADRGFVVKTKPLKDHASLLVFNSLNRQGDDPTGNLLVRQAISHAIDRKALVRAAYLGFASVSTQFGVGSHYANKAIVGYDYNVAKAKALLAQAGYPNGFSTQIAAASSIANRTALAIIQANLAAIGIDARIQLLTGAAANQAATGWGSGLWYHTSSIYVDVAMQMASIFSKGLTGGVLGLTTMLRPDDVNAALKRSVSSTSDAEAVAAVGEANRLLIDKYALYVPIAEYPYAYVTDRTVRESGIGDVYYSIATLSKAYIQS